jgi:hypothetical protein
MSLPRKGKTLWFVGTEWEGYVAVALVGGLGIGMLLVIAGMTSMLTF